MPGSGNGPGIGARHVSTSEGTSALATEAAKRAIADAGISPEEIEIVIVATSSPDRAFPSAAADVQGAIGAKHAVAFDITAACSGFIYALHIVQGFIQAGIYKTALIIGAETLSKVLDWTDRSSCILFGDGAGAAVVRADETGVVKTLVGSDGTKNDVLYCQARSLENCLTGGKPELGFMQMDGQEVFKFAVKKVPEIVNAILEETGTDREAGTALSAASGEYPDSGSGVAPSEGSDGQDSSQYRALRQYVGGFDSDSPG